MSHFPSWTQCQWVSISQDGHGNYQIFFPSGQRVPGTSKVNAVKVALWLQCRCVFVLQSSLCAISLHDCPWNFFIISPWESFFYCFFPNHYPWNFNVTDILYIRVYYVHLKTHKRLGYLRILHPLGIILPCWECMLYVVNDFPIPYFKKGMWRSTTAFELFFLFPNEWFSINDLPYLKTLWD